MAMFTEIENINNRPLTNVSDHFDNLEALLTNYFLLRKYNNMKISANKENINGRNKCKQIQSTFGDNACKSTCRPWRNEKSCKVDKEM